MAVFYWSRCNGIMVTSSLNLRRVITLSSVGLLAFVAACTSGGSSTGEPTPTSTPLVGQRAPTALVPVPPTPSINTTATSTPNPGATAQAIATGSPGATVTQLSGADTPSPTVTSLPAATATPTPEPTPALTLQSGQELVNVSVGILQLRPGIGQPVEFLPGVDSVNFRVNVGFTNPFHPDFSPWNYGIKFRDNGETFQMFVFDHEGNLNYIKGQGNQLTIVDSVVAENMLISGGTSNRVTFVVIEERAFVLLDQELITIFEIEPATDPDTAAGLSLVSDIYNQTTVVGAHTEFFDLSINSAGLVGFSESGELVREEPDMPALGDFSLPTSAGYARVTLISPINAFSGDYSYGLLFRSGSIGIDNWLVFDDAKNWRHLRRSSTGAESVFASGRADSLRIAAGNENLLEFLSTGEEHKVYLNGELLINMTLPLTDLPVSIAPIAAFESSHQTGGIATQYTDFGVWSVAE